MALAKPLTQLYLQTDAPNSEFMITLEQLLRANNITLASTRQQATAILQINNITQFSQLAALTGSAEAGQYQLFAQVYFSVQDQHGHRLLKNTMVQTSRSYNTNATQVLSSNNTSKQLWHNMQLELANEILSQLSAIKPATS